MVEEDIMDLEHRAIEHLRRLRLGASMTEAELGALAFPEAKNPRLKISGLSNVKTKNGAALRLRLGDFCSICEAMGKDPAQELFTVWAGFKSQEK